MGTGAVLAGPVVVVVVAVAVVVGAVGVDVVGPVVVGGAVVVGSVVGGAVVTGGALVDPRPASGAAEHAVVIGSAVATKTRAYLRHAVRVRVPARLIARKT